MSHAWLIHGPKVLWEWQCAYLCICIEFMCLLAQHRLLSLLVIQDMYTSSPFSLVFCLSFLPFSLSPVLPFYPDFSPNAFRILLNLPPWPLLFRCHPKCFFDSLSSFPLSSYFLHSLPLPSLFTSLWLSFPHASLWLSHSPISLFIIPPSSFQLFLFFTCSLPCLPTY